ncbi:STAS domain-containing protein [Dechloromonas sp. XY25]|uniref:STAS domain-containing protein n=1 Tax=Dechloromonas hankyongensis TaxID=2908002 RepID=A0ABS9JYT6_9RHOO|nr:STAS domain-containing protein [Dechloromonas hankyongensis]MCG2576070.1 STAS domain-containing protein [Dechloromonas hankyongensis]
MNHSRASILKLGQTLIVSVQEALMDADLTGLRDELVADVKKYRAACVVIDVTVLDVLDSFAARTLRHIAQMTQLLGARTVIVGIQPDVAFAMVQLGLTLEGTDTALDLEDALSLLNVKVG